MPHHHHSHHHAHDNHTHAPQSFHFAFIIAIICNLSFTILQVVYALSANSMSLLADAAHNFGDVFGLILAWGANWLLRLPARQRYSYGFKRATIISALTNALILVATTALITYESFYKLTHLALMDAVNAKIVVIVALIGIVVNGGTALLFMKGSHHDLNIKGAFLHLLGDALISIGVVLAGVLIIFTNYLWIDPLVGLFIVAIILWGTWGLLRDSIRLILDAIPHYIDYKGIQTYLQNLPGVEAVHDLHIWGLSTKEVALTVHLIMPEQPLSDEDYMKINGILKQQFRVDHATIQVEKGNHPEFKCARSETC